jgi:predicted phosphodiesterase
MKLLLTSDTHYGLDGKTHKKHIKFWRKVSKEIKDQDIKALLWAGDIASFRQRHFYKSLQMCREFVDIPVLLVRGNHDLWCGADKKDPDAPMIHLEKLDIQHNKWFDKFDIWHLENGPYIIDNVLICGFDGWYAIPDPATNDKKWMPRFVQGQPFVQEYLVNKAWEYFQNCLKLDTSKFRKSIIVTHHNPYPYMNLEFGANTKFLLQMKEKFDILCCGHTHAYKNDNEEGIQIYNCGSDYNDPKYLVFEV